MRTAYCFDDVLLTPSFSDIQSRSEIDISSHLAPWKLNIPIISSPMDTVTELEMSSKMFDCGGLGIIHRYNTVEKQCRIVQDVKIKRESIVGAAIGASGDFFNRASALVQSGADVLCVDIAHGHHSLMRHCLKVLRNSFGTTVHIMAGNVATLQAFNDLADWGADSIRVGIGGGSICSTRIKTGHGVPTLQSIIDCSYSDRDVALIADGGIRNSGDIVKALAAGADFVMLGSVLAGSSESPGEMVYINGEKFKTYRGMASVEAQLEWRGHTASVEGVSGMVPCRGSVEDILRELCTGIRSGLSYSGSRTILDIQEKSNFIIQTSAGSIESSTHIGMP